MLCRKIPNRQKTTTSNITKISVTKFKRFVKIKKAFSHDGPFDVEAYYRTPLNADFEQDAVDVTEGEPGVSFSMYLDQNEYITGEKVKISASVIDAPNPVTGASVITDIEYPTGTDQLSLYDDGTHGDGDADDGVYANYYENTDNDGVYTFTCTASGNTDEGPFSKTVEKSVHINESTEPNKPPVALPSVSYFQVIDTQVQFDGTDSYDSDGRIVSYEWKFGDGNTGNGAETTHVYSDYGDYTVSLTVTDNDGSTNTSEVSIKVLVPPVADAGGPYYVEDTLKIKFYGSASYDPDGTIIGYCWDFGDGTIGRSYDPEIIHNYSHLGIYDVKLTVVDGNGLSDTNTTYVEIVSTVQSDANGPYEGVVGIPIDFTGSASDGVPPYSYYWSFGDNVYSPDQNPSYKYKQPGTYTVSLKITDNIDGQDTDSTYAIIPPPETLMADAGGPYSGGVDQVIAFTGNAVGGVSPYTFEWDLDNDGDYDDATGQSASKSWSTIGTYTIGLKVTDNIGTTDTDTAQVSITSHAPNKPSKPSGPTSGKAGTEYTYTSSTTDPDDDDVFYLFDWDDGTDSGWLGPYDSGDTVTASHTCTEKGDYQIKVKAKDEYDVESPWSDPLSISMPKNKPYFNTPFLQFLQNLMQRFPLLARLLQLPVFNRLLNLR